MEVGIIGVGCIGSSLARVIRKKNLGKVAVADANTDYMRAAKTLELADSYCKSNRKAVENSDIVFVCVPVSFIPEVIADVAPFMKPGAILTDVGSVKTYVQDKAGRNFPGNFHFIPGHPITRNTAMKGPETGREDVFENISYILTPPENTDTHALKDLKHFISKLGAKVEIMNAERHDLILGFISHIPHFLAFSLMNAAGGLSKDLKENILNYAGGSFRDATRIVDANPDIWKDIFSFNNSMIENCIDVFSKEMETLKTYMKVQDQDAIRHYIEKAQQVKNNKSKKEQ